MKHRCCITQQRVHRASKRRVACSALTSVYAVSDSKAKNVSLCAKPAATAPAASCVTTSLCAIAIAITAAHTMSQYRVSYPKIERPLSSRCTCNCLGHQRNHGAFCAHACTLVMTATPQVTKAHLPVFPHTHNMSHNDTKEKLKCTSRIPSRLLLHLF
jgi:hypothetical protein